MPSAEQYPHLFKRNHSVSAGVKQQVDESERPLPVNEFVEKPLLSSEILDAALAAKMKGPALLRIKAVELTLKLLASRPINQDNFDKFYESIYTKLNGTKPR